jgi:hypothetical protein
VQILLQDGLVNEEINLSTPTIKPELLPIDECEEWIWDVLDSTKDSGFEYIVDGDKEFLIFNTNDFHADTKALYKIKKITGMRLVQMSSSNCYTQLWFYRQNHRVNESK